MTKKSRTSFTDDEKYLTLYDIQEYTSLSYNALKKAYQDKKLKSIQVGNKRLFKKEWVDEWLKGYIEPMITYALDDTQELTPELIERYEMEGIPKEIYLRGKDKQND